jgi:ribonuclease BN (tRNA processing enzyme)
LLNGIYRELPSRKSVFSEELPVVNLWRSRGICNTVFPAGLQGLQGSARVGFGPSFSVLFQTVHIMRLIFLGTGGYHPNERRHTASLLLPELGIALDAGTGFFRLPAHLKTSTLDVFLTHAHLDHVCGLTFILVPMLQGEISRVRVFGLRTTLEAVKTHLLANEMFPVLPDFEWVELDTVSEIPVPEGGHLLWTPLVHPGGSVGFRIDWHDRSIAYITDTTAPGDYCEFIRGVDLLIHECYFPDELHDWAEKTGHSCATPVALLAKQANVRELFLIHVDPQRPDDDPVGLSAIREIFPNTHLAEDLMEIEF